MRPSNVMLLILVVMANCNSPRGEPLQDWTSSMKEVMVASCENEWEACQAELFSCYNVQYACRSDLTICQDDLALKRPEWIACQQELNDCKDVLFAQGFELPERDTYSK